MSNGKWALITGATSGIGKAFAFHFAHEGYNIIATGTRATLLQNTVKELTTKFDIEATAFVGDLSDVSIQDKLISLGKEKQAVVLVNNAGFALNKLFYEADLDNWLQMNELHITCMIRLTYFLLPHMISCNEGIVINVASDAAYMIVQKNALYSGTKAYIRQFSQGLYLDLTDTNIYVQALCPGLTKTDLHEKMGMSKERQKNRGILRWEEPEQVVAQSVKAMRKNRAICISGISTKMLIILTSCIPKALYYRLVNSVFR